MSETSAACTCRAATTSGSAEICTTTIPASVTEKSELIPAPRWKKMSSVGLWITIFGSSPH
jgi:hypothetical protein